MVATVAHVVKGPLTIAGRKATVVRTIQTNGWEEIILLEVDWDWEAADIFDASTGEGYVIWSYDRAQSVRPSFVIKGDSGSPVLDRQGRLVGHVLAVQMIGTFVQVGIVSYYPSGIQFNRIEVARD